MKKLFLLILLLAWPAFGQTTLYLRDGTGDISGCVGVDSDMETSRGAGATTYRIDGSIRDNWNDTRMAGETRSGLWDCTIAFTVSAGAGGPNKATIYVERVNSSCVSQETIFSEETGTLAKGAQTVHSCTGSRPRRQRACDP
jgi:hypothetical protein